MASRDAVLRAILERQAGREPVADPLMYVSDPGLDPSLAPTTAGAEPNPDLLARFLRWLRATEGNPKVEAGRDVANALNAKLPDSLSARDAILKKRQEREKIDRMLADSI